MRPSMIAEVSTSMAERLRLALRPLALGAEARAAALAALGARLVGCRARRAAGSSRGCARRRRRTGTPARAPAAAADSARRTAAGARRTSPAPRRRGRARALHRRRPTRRRDAPVLLVRPSRLPVPEARRRSSRRAIRQVRLTRSRSSSEPREKKTEDGRGGPLDWPRPGCLRVLPGGRRPASRSASRSTLLVRGAGGPKRDRPPRPRSA